MRKNEMIATILQPFMAEKGFELETDKRNYWRWKKMISGVNEEVILMDMQQIVRLSIGKMGHGVAFVLGDELLHTLEHPRTKSDDWYYYGCEKAQRQERYENILYDIRDILLKNVDRILEEHAEKVKKAIPNRMHFEKLRDNYEKLVDEFSKKYDTENKNILEIVDIVMFQISRMFGLMLEEVEDELLGLAAIMYSEVQKQYGGSIKVYAEQENIMLVNIGKTKASFAFLVDVFAIWKDREWFNQYRTKIISWYNRENND